MNQNQRKALKAFLSPDTTTIKDVAEVAGLTRPTIYAYLADPEFKAALNQKQGAVIALATARLARLTEKALESLESVLDDPDQDGAANKRLAAKDILRLLDTYTDREIEDRIERLEDQILYS